MKINNKRDLFLKYKLFILSIILINDLFINIDSVLAYSWYEFSSSMSRSFNKVDIFSFSNLFILILIILTIAFIIYFLRREAVRQNLEARQAYKEFLKQQRIKRLPQAVEGQKRNWFRLKTELDIQWIPSSLADKYNKKDYYKGCVINISGGGLLFRSNELVTANEVEFYIELDGELMHLNGEVVRVEEEQENDDKKYLVGVKFINIKEVQRDYIISWITKSQREEVSNNKEELNEESEDNNEKTNKIEEFTANQETTNEKEDQDNLFRAEPIHFTGFKKDEQIQLKLDREGENVTIKGEVINSQEDDYGNLTITINITNPRKQ
ncbi:PilZ domain-containing protein [Candidatus Syntrophocurvum alkaliphilum]|nr:PilZ domain-containing protein [Candidatus Syntrophocurvum alkaliphilum]